MYTVATNGMPIIIARGRVLERNVKGERREEGVGGETREGRRERLWERKLGIRLWLFRDFTHVQISWDNCTASQDR